MIRTMNQVIEAMRGTWYTEGIPAIDLTALAPSFMALALLTNATFAPAASWGDNSD
jgi:hypothetical protein